jgi:deoxyribonuclease-1
VDFKERTAEPRNEVKGIAARATFYMYDRYGLSLSRQEQQLFMAWDRQYPVSAWEKEWNSRTSKIMGHPNPFITGDRSWSLGHKPTRDGIVSPIPARATAAPAEKAETRVIIGNRNSKIYHSPQGCPSYDKVAPKNQVPFTSEAKATASGYRKAGNCR